MNGHVLLLPLFTCPKSTFCNSCLFAARPPGPALGAREAGHGRGPWEPMRAHVLLPAPPAPDSDLAQCRQRKQVIAAECSKTNEKVRHGRPRIPAAGHVLLRGPGGLGKVRHGPGRNSREGPRLTSRRPGLSESKAWPRPGFPWATTSYFTFVSLWKINIL